MLEGLRNKLSGSKTYIVAAAGILGAVGAWVSGAIQPEEAVKIIWAAILTMTTRAAIQKSENQK